MHLAASGNMKEGVAVEKEGRFAVWLTLEDHRQRHGILKDGIDLTLVSQIYVNLKAMRSCETDKGGETRMQTW